MTKLFITMSAALAVLWWAIAPAAAIVNGELDGNGHPNVGRTILVKYDPTQPNGVSKGGHCSGTLIAPTVFLTAAHCGLSAQLNAPFEPWVTFNPDFAAAISVCSADASGVVTCPGSIKVLENIPYSEYFWGWGHTDRPEDTDLAVYILSEAVNDIAPASLPTLNYLDGLKASNGLHGAMFTVVGFGYQATFMEGKPTYVNDRQRRVAASEYLALNPGYLVLSQNVALDNGGGCWYDSGGAVFYGETLVAVVSLGDNACRAVNIPCRLDTAIAREFLGNFIVLP